MDDKFYNSHFLPTAVDVCWGGGGTCAHVLGVVCLGGGGVPSGGLVYIQGYNQEPPFSDFLTDDLQNITFLQIPLVRVIKNLIYGYKLHYCIFLPLACLLSLLLMVAVDRMECTVSIYNFFFGTF